MRIRLLIVIGSLNRGGCEGQLVKILPRLNSDRICPEVFVLHERGVFADALEAQGVKVYGPGLRPGKRKTMAARAVFLVVAAVRLWSHLLRKRPEIVHFFLPESYIIGAPVALLAGIRCRVLSRRSLNDYKRQRPLVAAIEHLLHRTTTAFVGNSSMVVRQLVEQEGVPSSRTTVIHNGVSIPGSLAPGEMENIRQVHGIGLQTFVMVVVANLIPYKNHRTLINACARAKTRLSGEWCLLVIGRDDGIGDDLRELAVYHRISRNIVFLGERNDVESILPACDLGVLVSRQEGFSNALLECMAAGLPMLVSEVGGNTEAVLDGVTGRIVSADDEVAMSEAIVAFAHNPGMRRAMGRAGRKRVSDLFGLERCIKHYQEFYIALVDDNRASRALAR